MQIHEFKMSSKINGNKLQSLKDIQNVIRSPDTNARSRVGFPLFHTPIVVCALDNYLLDRKTFFLPFSGVNVAN